MFVCVYGCVYGCACVCVREIKRLDISYFYFVSDYVTKGLVNDPIYFTNQIKFKNH